MHLRTRDYIWHVSVTANWALRPGSALIAADSGENLP